MLLLLPPSLVLQVGGPVLSPYAAQYATLVASLTARVRAAGPQWWVAGSYGMHALAAAVTGGWTTSAEQAAFFAAAFSSPGLICSLSNFDTGYVLEALGVMGQGAAFIDALRRCWGVQLAHGASCWWESTDFYGAMGSFDDGGAGAVSRSSSSSSSSFSSMSARGTAATSPALPRGGAPSAAAVLPPAAPLSMDVLPGATTSACHAWGSYPTVAMQRWLLGVRAAAAGFTRVLVAPLIGLGGGWLQRVSGDVPTPLGIIRVAAVAAASPSPSAAAMLSISVEAPAGVLVVEVQVPRVLPGGVGGVGSSCSLTSIDVDGVPIPAQQHRVVDAGSGRAALAFDLPAPAPQPLQRRPRVPGAAAAQVHPRARVVTARYGPACSASPQAPQAALRAGARQPVPVAAPVTQAEAGSGSSSVQPEAAPLVSPSPSASASPTPPWPLSVSIDSSTHGAWLKRGLYGRKGYVLFAYDKGPRGTAVDRTSLPPSVSVSLPSGVHRSLSNTSSVATAKLQV